MIKIQTQWKKSQYSYIHNNITAKSLYTLAYKLLQFGIQDQGWEVYWEGKRTLYGNSLNLLARKRRKK